MDTKKVANDIEKTIAFIRSAHIDFPKKEKDSVRFHDNSTPYIVHPILCAMTILSEPNLDEHIRIIGYQALLLHDVLEDTTANLPENINAEVKELVKGMTFESFQEEREKIWSCSKLVRLLKLYDKTSNLLDGVHMNQNKWNRYVELTIQLIADVEANFGELNIVKISKAIAIYK